MLCGHQVRSKNRLENQIKYDDLIVGARQKSRRVVAAAQQSPARMPVYVCSYMDEIYVHLKVYVASLSLLSMDIFTALTHLQLLGIGP